MRILKLRLKNLNSLAGEWHIDFTNPAYLANGLFAITGPTGVGKTTILDAICLALYGRTPRLDKLTSSSNEIMSRRTGECAAELTFETQTGRFRATWSQQRANKKIEGRLQNPQHEIVALGEGEIGRVLEKSLSKTPAEIERVMGMNFDQFSRSILLAQGAFAAFLTAKADERADLLEKLTGTDIYSEISIAAHGRKTEENKKKESLEIQLQSVPNKDLDEGTLLAQQKELQKKLVELETALAKTTEICGWLKKIGELETDRQKLLDQEKKWAERFGLFQPQTLRLARGTQARPFEGLYSQLKTLRHQLQENEKKLALTRDQLPALISASAQKMDIFKKAEAELAQAKAKEAQLRPQLTQVRELDIKISENLKGQQPRKEKLKAIADQLHQATEGTFTVAKHDLEHWSQKLKDIRIDLTHLKEESATAQKELTNLLKGQELSVWRSRHQALERMSDRLREIGPKLARRHKLAQELAQTKLDIAKSELALKAAGAELEVAEGKLKNLQTEEEHLLARWNLQQRVKSLEAQRPHLLNGKPCPLCGSLDHPYADPAAVPPGDVTQDQLDDLKKKMAAATKRLSSLTSEKSKETQLLASLRQSEIKLGVDSAALEEEIIVGLNSLSVNDLADISPNGPPQMLPLLQEDYKQPQTVDLEAQAAKRTKEVEAELAPLTPKLNRAEILEKENQSREKELARQGEVALKVENFLTQAGEIKSELVSLQEDQKALNEQRHQLFGAQKADDVEKALQKSVQEAEKGVEDSRREASAAESAVAEQKTILAQTEKIKVEVGQAVESLVAKFRQATQANGFPDETSWLAALLSEEERASLEKQARQLENEKVTLAAGLADTTAKLQIERLKKNSPLTLAEAVAQQAEQEKARLSLGQNLGAINQKLADYAQASGRLKELGALLDAQKRECRRWEKLHELIGSADGKKFRQFAQGLTFEIMVGQANRQLTLLSDRYLLMRDPALPLELKVVDNYQAGEIRSTKNLSGGESFLVSLALALGLSKMASQKVRVDSLFLDEGFGTLDEETLDTALETLAALNQEGKLIGVISHIPTLINRIATQIKVRPHPGGRSALSGPGVSGG